MNSEYQEPAVSISDLRQEDSRRSFSSGEPFEWMRSMSALTSFIRVWGMIPGLHSTNRLIYERFRQQRSTILLQSMYHLSLCEILSTASSDFLIILLIFFSYLNLSLKWEEKIFEKLVFQKVRWLSLMRLVALKYSFEKGDSRWSFEKRQQ